MRRVNKRNVRNVGRKNMIPSTADDDDDEVEQWMLIDDVWSRCISIINVMTAPFISKHFFVFSFSHGVFFVQTL